MAHNAPSHETSATPADLIADRRAGWNAFTRFIMINCVALAALLIVLLLVFRVL